MEKFSSKLNSLIEELEKKSKEYYSHASEEEKLKIDSFKKESEEWNEKAKKFWEETYPKMSLDEKKKYWLASTHKGMRTQGEAFADPYSEFSKEWYDFAKQHEPNFDEIFDYVTKNLGFEFDWQEFKKRIKQ